MKKIIKISRWRKFIRFINYLPRKIIWILTIKFVKPRFYIDRFHIDDNKLTFWIGGDWYSIKKEYYDVNCKSGKSSDFFFIEK